MKKTNRKFHLTLLALALIVLGFVLCGRPQALYGQYCIAVLVACGLYKAANVLDTVAQNKPPVAPEQ